MDINGVARNHTEESKKIKFVYLRSRHSQNHVVTIGYLWNRETGEVNYEVARCARGDAFCKRVGRDIVTGRYAKYGPRYLLMNCNSPEDIYEQFEILWHPDYEPVGGEGYIPPSTFNLEERV